MDATSAATNATTIGETIGATNATLPVTRHDDLLGGLGVRNQLTPGCCFRVRVSLDEPGPALKVAIAAIFTLQKMHGSAEALGQDPLGVLETCGFQGAQGEAKDQSPIISRDNCLAGTM